MHAPISKNTSRYTHHSSMHLRSTMHPLFEPVLAAHGKYRVN